MNGCCGFPSGRKCCCDLPSSRVSADEPCSTIQCFKVLKNKSECCTDKTNNICVVPADEGKSNFSQCRCAVRPSTSNKKKYFGSDLASLNMLLRLKKKYPKIFHKLIHYNVCKRVKGKSRPSLNVSFRNNHNKNSKKCKQSTMAIAKQKITSCGKSAQKIIRKQQNQRQTKAVQTTSPSHFKNVLPVATAPTLESNQTKSRTLLIGVQSQVRIKSDNFLEEKQKFLKEYTNALAKDVNIAETFDNLRKYFPNEIASINATDKSIERISKTLDKKFRKENILQNINDQKFGNILETLKVKYPKDAEFVNKGVENIESQWKNLKNKLTIEPGLGVQTTIDSTFQTLKEKYPDEKLLGTQPLQKNIFSKDIAHPIDEIMQPILERLRKKFPNEKSLATATYNNIGDIFENLKKKYPKHRAFTNEIIQRFLGNLKQKYPAEKLIQNTTYKDILYVLEILKRKHLNEAQKNIKSNDDDNRNHSLHNVMNEVLQPFIDGLSRKFPFEDYLDDVTHANIGDILQKLKRKFPRNTTFTEQLQKKIDDMLGESVQPLLEKLKAKYPNEKLLTNVNYGNIVGILKIIKEKHHKDMEYITEAENVVKNNLLNSKFFDKKTFDYFLDLSIQPILTKIRKFYPKEKSLNNATHDNISDIIGDLRKKHPDGYDLINELGANVDRNLKCLRLARDHSLNNCIADIFEDLRRIFRQEKILHYANYKHIRNILELFRKKYPELIPYIAVVEQQIEMNLANCTFEKSNPFNYKIDGDMQLLLKRLKKRFPDEAVLHTANESNIEGILEYLNAKHSSELHINYKPNGLIDDIFVNISKSEEKLNEVGYRPTFRSVKTWTQILAERQKVIKLIKRRTGKDMCKMLMNKEIDENLIYILKELLDDEISYDSRRERKRKLQALRRHLSELGVCTKTGIPAVNKRHMRCFEKKQEVEPEMREDRHSWKFQLLEEAKETQRQQQKSLYYASNKSHFYYAKDNPTCLYLIDDIDMCTDSPFVRIQQKFDFMA